MAFDPAQYLKEKTSSGSGFDPAKYLKEKTGSAPTEQSAPISELESGLRGAAEGASFGAAPAITGALDALPTASDALFGQSSLQDVINKYNKSREESKANYDAAQKANPKSYFAGSLAGGLFPAALTGGASEAASGASMLENAALQGAKYGALTGAGTSISAGPKDLGDVAESTIKGGASGAVLGAALGKIGSMLPGAESLEETANERAVKSTGVGKQQLKRMLMNDAKTNAYNAANSGGVAQEPVSTVQMMGKRLLEPNAYIDEPVVTSLSTPEEVLSKSQELAQKTGQAIGGILKEFDAQHTAQNPQLVGKFFNPSDAAQEVENQLLKPLMVNGQIPPVSEPVASKVQSVIDTIAQYGNNPIPFEKAQELKVLIQNLANYETEGSAANQVFKRSAGIINRGIEDAADDVVKSAGKPELLDKFLDAKELYRTAKMAEQASLGKSAANMVNRDFGITDYMSAAAGAAAKGPIGGVVAPLANKAAKTYGNSLVATGAKGMSNSLSIVNKYISEIPKEKIVQLGQQLTQQSDPLSQKLGNVLTQAGNRDDIGRNALMFSIMQNPGYRELMRKYFGGSAASEGSQK